MKSLLTMLASIVLAVSLQGCGDSKEQAPPADIAEEGPADSTTVGAPAEAPKNVR